MPVNGRVSNIGCGVRNSRFRFRGCRLPWIVVVALAVPCFGQVPAPGTPPELPREARVEIGQLRERVRTHRYAAEYAEAVLLAERIAAVRRQHQGESWWETTDANRSAEHLVRIAALPAEVQQELAATERTDVDAFRLHQERKFDEAIALLEARVALSRKHLGDSQEAADLLQGLASMYRNAGRLDDVFDAARTVLTILKSCVEPDHPRVVNAVGNVGNAARELGRLREAFPYLAEGFTQTAEILGAFDDKVRAAADNFAMFLLEAGQYQAAEEVARNNIRIAYQQFGSDHDHAVRARTVLATVLQARGKLAEAEPLVRVTFESMKQLLGWNHGSTLTVATQLALILQSEGRLADALELFELARNARRLGEESLQEELSEASRRVGVVLSLLGRNEEALDELKRAESLATRQHRAAEALRASIALVAVHTELSSSTKPSHTEQANRWIATNRERAALLPPNHPLTIAARSTEVDALRAQGRHDEAEPIARALVALDTNQAAYPRPIDPLVTLARVIEAKSPVEASDLLHEALRRIDDAHRLTSGSRGEAEPARHSLSGRRVSVLAARAATAARNPGRALHALERGRCRELLEVARLHSSRPIGRSATAVEDDARFTLNDAVSQLLALGRYQQPPEEAVTRLAATRAQASAGLIRAEQATLNACREEWPAGRAATLAEARELLTEGEHLFVYGATRDAVVLVSVPAAGRGEPQSWTLATGDDAAQWDRTIRSTCAALAERRSLPIDPASLLDLVLPAECRSHAAAAKRWIVVPDGAVVGLPLEFMTATELPTTAITYAPSATSLRELRSRPAAIASGTGSSNTAPSKTAQTDTALIVSDPGFERSSTEVKPPAGIVVRRVQEGLNAHAAGLRVGDIVTSYARVEIRSLDDFDVAIRKVNDELSSGAIGGEAQLELSYWRDGTAHRTSIRAGRLGVRFDPGSSDVALAMLKRRSKTPEQSFCESQAAVLRATHGGALRGNRRSSVARGVVAILENAPFEMTSLAGEAATASALVSSSPKAVVHIAAPAYSGVRGNPSSGNIALTQPKESSAKDFGFLTLDSLLHESAVLQTGALVVLSNCRSFNEDAAAASPELTLHWGLCNAGAGQVVTTLWPIDEGCGSLFFAEFYRGLQGKTQRSVDVALREAREQIKNMTAAQAQRRLGLTESEFKSRYPGSGGAAASPFAHPHYWAGVVSVGQ